MKKILILCEKAFWTIYCKILRFVIVSYLFLVVKILRFLSKYEILSWCHTIWLIFKFLLMKINKLILKLWKKH